MPELQMLRSASVLSLLASIVLVGCSRGSDQIDIDPRYSYNVSIVPYNFPKRPDALPMIQQGILAQHGPPSFIHYFWKPNGEFITSSDLSGKAPEDVQVDFENMKITWVYTDFRTEDITERDFEVEFPSVGPPRIYPISKKLKLVCRYGDPDFGEPRTGQKGETIETWMWMEHGLMIDLVDGDIGKKTTFPKTGTRTIIK